MEHGDISNITPPRWLITLDVLMDGKILPRRRLFESWLKYVSRVHIDPLVLGTLWKWTYRTPIIFEAVYFEIDDADFGLALEERFEREGWQHPIRYIVGYADRESLRESITYRPDVQAVIDLPENALFWGSRGTTLEVLR